MFSIKQTTRIDRVHALHSDTLPEDEQYIRSGNRYWLVKKGRKEVGFAILTILDKEIAFLSRAGLLPCARGKGLHTRLIRVRERYARKHGIKKIITYTTRDNITSAHNLEKNGYRLYIPDNQYGGKEMLYFMKEL